MGSSSNKNNARALKQWRQFFTSQSSSCSEEAHAHWKNVERLGLPTRQDENWKYTPLHKFLSHNFTAPTTQAVSTEGCEIFGLSLNAYRLVFIDGRLAKTPNDNDTGMWQVEVEKGVTRKALLPPIQSEVFLHLTESLCQEITRILLPAGSIEKRPLYLLHISRGSKEKETLSTLHYRHHLDIEENADGQVIEHFVSADTYGHFIGTRTSITVGNNAHLSYIKLVFEGPNSHHFAHNDINVGQDTVVRSSIFILGAYLTRHQTSAQMNGERSSLVMNSLLLASGHSISDSRTYLEHNKGYCMSRQLHKIIAQDHSKGIFNGLIKVAKNAFKTDSQMTNNNLTLNHLAEVNSKPQLEIYADDVKCSHGATVGCLDEEQVFYLRSRGIAREEAQQMMIYAFAAEIVEAINHDAVRKTVLMYVANTLRERAAR